MKPKKLSLIEMQKLYRLLKPYLHDDYLEIARQILYTDKEGFYIAINTLCKLDKPKYNRRDFLSLISVFRNGLIINEFSLYAHLVSEMSIGRPKQ